MSDLNQLTNSNGNDNGGSNAWPMWQRLVLAEIERHDRELKDHCEKDEKRRDALNIEVQQLKTDMAVIKGKAALIGTGAGLLVSLLIQFAILVIKYYGGL